MPVGMVILADVTEVEDRVGRQRRQEEQARQRGEPGERDQRLGPPSIARREQGQSSPLSDELAPTAALAARSTMSYFLAKYRNDLKVIPRRRAACD